MMINDRGDPGLIRVAGTSGETGFGIINLVRSIARNSGLVRELSRRELTDLHAGQAAGVIWLIVHPLLMFLVYAFLFTLVFKVRIGSNGPSDYLTYLFSGLTPWLLTQDILARAPNTLLANQTIVKKVMFPTETLVAKTVLSSLFVQSILMAVVIAYIIAARGQVDAMLVMLPLLFALHVLLLWGLALLLASLTPFLRDISEVVRVFVTVSIYLMPIMYLPSMLPGKMRYALAINPFSHLIWCYQDILYFNRFEHPWSWFVLALLAFCATAVGSYVFTRLRHHFADVL